jgi:uroporphyrinogen decarboxylase
MLRAPLPRGNAELNEINHAETDIWDESAEIRDSEDADRIIPIRSSAELLASGELDILRRVVEDYGHRIFVSTILDTPFSEVSDHLGFYGLMTTQHDRPELLHYMLQRQLLQAKEWMAALAAVGVHGVYVQEVFTGADLISPRAYKEFVLDYNRPYFKHMRGLGLLPIHYVCGDVVPRLDQMASCDVAAIAVEESKKNFTIEIEEVVARVGDQVAVLGNIDAVQFGLNTPLDEMAAEVRRQARIGARAKGFVLSTGSPFPLDTNPRLIDTMVATAHSIAV